MPTEEKYFLQLPASAEATLFDSDFLASAFFVSDFVSVFVSDFVSALVSVLSEASAVFLGVSAAGCSGAEETCERLLREARLGRHVDLARPSGSARSR